MCGAHLKEETVKKWLCANSAVANSCGIANAAVLPKRNHASCNQTSASAQRDHFTS
jgi:hypothetical protein